MSQHGLDATILKLNSLYNVAKIRDIFVHVGVLAESWIAESSRIKTSKNKIVMTDREEWWRNTVIRMRLNNIDMS